jgi:hypothetical protein
MPLSLLPEGFRPTHAIGIFVRGNITDSHVRAKQGAGNTLVPAIRRYPPASFARQKSFYAT